MKLGKSPGPDGLTLQYYKCFLDALSPSLLSANPNISLGGILEAHITVIPKEGKDTFQVSNIGPYPC